MKLIYEGKTKRVYERDNESVILYFKDDVTGTGDVIDPGGNEVVGEVEGKGMSSLKLTDYFFDLLDKNGISTHYIKTDFNENSMIVKKADMFGLEVVCRVYAYGSFLRRYPEISKEMQFLDYLVEVTVKDDDRGDPLINDETLIKLNVLSEKQLNEIKEITKNATKIIETNLKEKDLELIDLKYEFGKIEDKIVIIDEISGDSMRVRKDEKVLSQKELSKYLLD